MVTSRGRATGRAGRGQVLTVEAFLAAALLVGSLLFALQATAVTPMSSSTSSEQIEAQQAQLAAGVLDSAVASGSLRPMVLYWNDTGARFHGASQKGFYRNSAPGTAFGNLTERTLRDRGVAYNVAVQYVTRSGAVRHRKLLHVGTPSDNVAAASRTVTLADHDVLRNASGGPTNRTLANATNYFAPDAAPNSSVYNVVRVEVTVWRS